MSRSQTGLDAALARLRATDPRVAGGIRAFDAALADVMVLDDPRAFAPLAALFIEEEGDHEDAMWSLLHAVEHLGMDGGPDRYAARLLAVFPSLCRTAPRWAELLLVRVLNSPSHTAALRDRMDANATPGERDVVATLAQRIVRASPEFREKADRLGLA